MCYLVESFGYENDSSLHQHILSSAGTLNTLVDDVILVNVSIDGGSSANLEDWSGYTEIVGGWKNAVYHYVRWIKVTADGQQVPDAFLYQTGMVTPGSENLCANIAVIRGADTTTPIGNTVAEDDVGWQDSDPNDEDAKPKCASISVSANSSVFYFGSLDSMTWTDIPGKHVVSILDSDGNSSIMGYDFFETAASTGTVYFHSTESDGWQTLAVEIKDDGNGTKPLYFESRVVEEIDEDDYTRDDVTFRDVMATAGILIDADTTRTQLTATFDMSSGVDTGTEVITLDGGGLDESAHGRIFQLTSASGTAPTGLALDSYYYVDWTSATSIKLKLCDALDVWMFNPMTATNITGAGSGTGTLSEIGVGVQTAEFGYNYDRMSLSHYSDQNYWGSAKLFTTPRDMTGEVLAFDKIVTHAGMIEDGFYLLIDSDGDWKAWRCLKDEIILSSDPQVVLIDIDNSTPHKEAGTFNSASVEYAVLLWKPSYASARTEITFVDPYVFLPIVVLGGDSTNPVTFQKIYDWLQHEITNTSANPSGVQFVFAHNLQFGNGTESMYFLDSEKCLSFPPLADGVTKINTYLSDLILETNTKAGDSFSLFNSQIAADTPFSLTDNTGSSISPDYAGSISVNGTVNIRSGVTLSDMILVGGDGINFNTGGILSNSTITKSNLETGAVVAVTGDNTQLDTILFKENDAAIQIDTTGTYNFTDISFTDNVIDLHVTATTGDVIANMNGGTIPDYTSSGATVTVNSVKTITVGVVTSDRTPIENARVEVSSAETTGTLTAGDVILTGVTDTGGILTTSAFNFEAAFGSSLDVGIKVRKSSSAPYYKAVDSNGEITLSAGLTTTVTMGLDQ